MSQPLTILEGAAAPLPFDNIDTDKILPSRFLKTIRREGLGSALFHSLRYRDDGEERPEFILNQAPWREARFLIALDNFGCGSSREHAPWALLDFGIRCIVAPSFADIFFSNCIKNGILPLNLGRSTCEQLITSISRQETSSLRLNLVDQSLMTTAGDCIPFSVDPDQKRRLLKGLDEIQETLGYIDLIAAHDAQCTYSRPQVPIHMDQLLINHGLATKALIQRATDNG